MNMVELGTVISPAKVERCGLREYPVLSMTMHDGLVFQNEKFKKSVASKDKSTYKVVFRNQLVISFPIDEGVLATQRITDAGIVSPAYGIWDIAQEKVIPEYLEYALRCGRAINYYKAKLRGSTARRRSLPTPTLLAFQIPLPTLQEQSHILEVLHLAQDIISDRKRQLEELDTFVKARFVEMFGDPVRNEKKWPICKLTNLSEIKIGPFGSLLHKEDYIEGGHPLVNPSHIIEGKICIDPKLTVSDGKYQELKAYQLIPEDIVLGRRGEMGRCAVVTESGMLCGTGSMIIRPTQKMKAYFLQNILSSPTYKSIIETRAVGVTMLNLNVPIVAELDVPLLPIDLQNEYIDFLRQIDKSKVVVQGVLCELYLRSTL